MYAKAIDIFRKGLVVDPDDPGMHYFLGIVFMNAGELDNAVKEFKYTLELSPDHAGAFYSLGNAYYDKNMLDAALASYRVP